MTPAVIRWVPYETQRARWPAEGRHVMAAFDERSVVLYQAYTPEIAEWAVTHQAFGGPAFGYGRMSWVKPNFLWMMYRCGWASKERQERVLAVQVVREGFDQMLDAAVESRFDERAHPTEADWRQALANSEVRLQWDPDHDPSGAPVTRRALQLGLRGSFLHRYGRDWIVRIDDITADVVARRSVARGDLTTPEEHPYPLSSSQRRALGV